MSAAPLPTQADEAIAAGRRALLAPDTGYRLELPYPPSANVYYRSVNGRTLISREGRDYKTRVAVRVMLDQRDLSPRPGPFRGPVAVRIDLYRPRKAGDLDNRVKPLLDALNGMAWLDDRQVAELHVYRHDDKANPRAEVRVWPARDA